MAERKLLIGCQAKAGHLQDVFSKEDPQSVGDFMTTISMIGIVIKKMLARTGRARRPLKIDMSLLESMLVLLEEFAARIDELGDAGSVGKQLAKNRKRKVIEDINSRLYEVINTVVLALKSEQPEPAGAALGTTSSRNIEARRGRPRPQRARGSRPSVRGEAMTGEEGELRSSDESSPVRQELVGPEAAVVAQEAIPRQDSSDPAGPSEVVETADPAPTLAQRGRSSTAALAALLRGEDEDGDDKSVDELESMAQRMIFGSDSAAWWGRAFGPATFQVSLSEFVRELRRQFPNFGPDDEPILRDIVDTGGNVNMYKFSELLRAHGPFARVVDNMRNVARAPWFHGHMTSKEAELFLAGQNAGTYLVRYSRSNDGAFALAFVIADGRTLHVLLRPVLPEGFTIEENGQLRRFPSLEAVLQYYTAFLQRPFTAKMNAFGWFFGDLPTSEATQLLTGQRIGTFLVRFSSMKGAYAVSHVAEGGAVVHSLILSERGLYHFKNHNVMYDSVQALVAGYNSFLLYPFSHDTSIAALSMKFSGVLNSARFGMKR